MTRSIGDQPRIFWGRTRLESGREASPAFSTPRCSAKCPSCGRPSNRTFLFNRMPDKSRLAFSVTAKQDILPRDPSNPNREITMTTEAEKTQRKASCPRTMVYRNVPPRGRLSSKGLLFNRVPNKSRLAFSVIAKQDILTTRLIEPQSRNQCRRPKRKKTQRKRIDAPSKPTYKTCTARVTRYPPRRTIVLHRSLGDSSPAGYPLCSEAATCPSERSLSA